MTQHSFKDRYCPSARTILLFSYFQNTASLLLLKEFSCHFFVDRSQDFLTVSSSADLKIKSSTLYKQQCRPSRQWFLLNLPTLKKKQIVCHAPWPEHTNTLFHLLMKSRPKYIMHTVIQGSATLNVKACSHGGLFAVFKSCGHTKNCICMNQVLNLPCYAEVLYSSTSITFFKLSSGGENGRKQRKCLETSFW